MQRNNGGYSSSQNSYNSGQGGYSSSQNNPPSGGGYQSSPQGGYGSSQGGHAPAQHSNYSSSNPYHGQQRVVHSNYQQHGMFGRPHYHQTTHHEHYVEPPCCNII